MRPRGNIFIPPAFERDSVVLLLYTRFERARLLGARALQISLGAPILLVPDDTSADPLRIAEREFAAGSLPLTAPRAVDALH